MTSFLPDQEILFKLTFQGKWSEVVEMYRSKPSIHHTKIMNTEETALHMAVDDGREHTVMELVRIIEDNGNVNALKIQNERGDTPLHRAAMRGSVAMCIALAKPELLTVTNNWDETPLFLANHKEVFQLLQSAHELGDIPVARRRNIDGDTLLHCAIEREHLGLALYIFHEYPDLAYSVNERGISPLQVLASKPGLFKSGSRLTWWNQILYYCIYVDPHLRRKQPQWLKKKEYPENYQTCYDIAVGAVGISCAGRKGAYYGEEENLNYLANDQNIPENYATCYDLLTTVILHVFGFLGFGDSFTVVWNLRENHACSVQLLDKLMENPSLAYLKDGRDPNLEESDTFMGKDFRTTILAANIVKNDGQREIETPFIVAAKNGVVEIMKKILHHLPMAIYETDSENKNILQLSVENRQPYIFEALRNNNTVRDKLIRTVDKEGNTISHLAAKLSKYKPWLIPGSALQMQWEVKWFLYVKELMPQDFHFKRNGKNHTAAEIFDNDHKDLVKDGTDWLKSTSESCSVVAALIAGVAFATSSSIPGGTQDKTGKPKLENHPAFEIFAIASLIALCFSVTGLLMFLSILTSRQQRRDFHKDLPYKLLLGLTSLFLSIPSMLVSFCAGHFFVLKDNLKQAVFPIYGAICFPVVIFFAASQFPLYVDLLTATYKKVPQPGHPNDDL